MVDLIGIARVTAGKSSSLKLHSMETFLLISHSTLSMGYFAVWHVRLPPGAVADCFWVCVYFATLIRHAPRLGNIHLVVTYQKTAIFIYAFFDLIPLLVASPSSEVMTSRNLMRFRSQSLIRFIVFIPNVGQLHRMLHCCVFGLLDLLHIMHYFPAHIAFYFQSPNFIVLLFLSFIMLNS